MSVARQVYEFLKASSIAHAQWDLEVSTSIIKNRRKLIVLLLLLMPILVVSLLEAAPLLGGKEAYAPAFYSTNIFLISIGIGLAAGLITGCIGAGGGFIITPALMAAGVKGILAVGTDMFHIFAKAIMGTAVHKKLGNVSWKLAIAFLVGSGGGTFIGGYLNRMLYVMNPILSDAFISSVYSVILGFLGFYALFDFMKLRKGGTAVEMHTVGPSGGTPNIAVKLQAIKVPPMIPFDEDFVPGGKKISWLIVALGGLVVGILATLMGAGGGFVTFPDVCIHIRCFLHDDGRHRYSSDHLHRRSWGHRAVCDLWIRFLHAGHGNADRFAHRHPGRRTDHQGRKGHSHPRLLRCIHPGRFRKPNCHAPQENGRTRDR